MWLGLWVVRGRPAGWVGGGAALGGVWVVGLYAGGRLYEAAWTRLDARRAYLADCVQANVMDFTSRAVKECVLTPAAAAGSGPRSRTLTRRGLGYGAGCVRSVCRARVAADIFMC